jgi:hypothetical protein
VHGAQDALDLAPTARRAAWASTGEASSAEVAENGQHNSNDYDDPKPGRHVHLLFLGVD